MGYAEEHPTTWNNEHGQAGADSTGEPRWSGAEGRAPLPLGSYAALVATYGAGVVALLAWADERDKLLGEVSLADLAVIGVGSHKLARMISKDRVVTVFRSPFTDYKGTDGALPGEAKESARKDGSGMRQAIGELISCPYCTATWATGLVFGSYLVDRKVGRTLGTLLSAISLADVAHATYVKLVGG